MVAVWLVVYPIIYNHTSRPFHRLPPPKCFSQWMSDCYWVGLLECRALHYCCRFTLLVLTRAVGLCYVRTFVSLLHIYGISAESSVKCSYLFIVSDCWNVHLNRPALAEPKIMGVTSPDSMTGSELVICCLRTQHPIWRDELALNICL